MFRSEYPIRRSGSRLFGEDFLPIPRSFQRAIDSVFQDMLEPGVLQGALAFQPQVDVHEDEHQLKVVAELPGLEEKDVEIVYEPGSLVLRGEKKEEAHGETPRGRGRWEERRYGAFERRIPIQGEIEEGQIQANFDRGLLTITLPKSAEARAQARKIPIRGGAQAGQVEQQQQGGRGRSSPSGEQGQAAH